MVDSFLSLVFVVFFEAAMTGGKVDAQRRTLEVT